MEKIKEMSIDLETYSDVDIKKSGVYKYAESENFEILFAVSINGGDVLVYDLACGDVLPDEILDAIVSDDIIKWAFNASFERICLSYWIKRNYPDRFCSYSIPEDTVGNYLDPASWRCTMIWSAYMGLPLSLKGVGAVLGLKDQKMKEGKDLIRYFCVPCKPTKSNGGRTRNLPMHAPEKWTVFKSYNKRDIEVEMGIKDKLHKFPVPDFIWDEYHLDQEINEALVPFLAHEVLKNYHQDIRDGIRKRNEGIIEDNFETWNIRGRKILVGFTAIHKDQVESYMEGFWKEKDAYLESTRKKRCLILNSKGEYIRCPKCNKCEGCERSEKDQYLSRYISLDKFMDDNSDDNTNRSGWEPTDNTSTENSVLSLIMIDNLINEVSLKYPEAKAIFSLLMDDPQISNALKQVDLKKGKSQAYEYVKKMQAYAKELYNKNYR